MPRYVAFLRGVTPMNARMPALKACFEAAGFSDVHTLLSSGNVVFNARSIVRSAEYLQQFIAADPFAELRLAPTAKRIVTFLRQPVRHALELPIERDGASILKLVNSEVLCAYVPNPKGPVFMSLLEKTFGTGITTRTLDTVRRCARA
ncbi:MAG: DUF1697 domain-containing protein [Steroidobacteraceae bacterium]